MSSSQATECFISIRLPIRQALFGFDSREFGLRGRLGSKLQNCRLTKIVGRIPVVVQLLVQSTLSGLRVFNRNLQTLYLTCCAPREFPLNNRPEPRYAFLTVSTEIMGLQGWGRPGHPSGHTDERASLASDTRGRTVASHLRRVLSTPSNPVSRVFLTSARPHCARSPSDGSIEAPSRQSPMSAAHTAQLWALEHILEAGVDTDVIDEIIPIIPEDLPPRLKSRLSLALLRNALRDGSPVERHALQAARQDPTPPRPHRRRPREPNSTPTSSPPSSSTLPIGTSFTFAPPRRTLPGRMPVPARVRGDEARRRKQESSTSLAPARNTPPRYRSTSSDRTRSAIRCASARTRSANASAEHLSTASSTTQRREGTTCARRPRTSSSRD